MENKTNILATNCCITLYLCHCCVGILCQCAKFYCCSTEYSQPTGSAGSIYIATITFEKISYIKIDENITVLFQNELSLDINLQLPKITNN